jgi:hypothetical protein
MKRKRTFVLAILFIAFGLRVILAFINRQANDDHMEVINWIVNKANVPIRDNCGICYQPKFFYVISANIITFFKIQTDDHRIIAIQLFNAILGFFTILFFWKFINKQPFNDSTKLLLFAFFAFNPCLTGINVQATNDTLVILGGVMSVYFCDLFFRNITVTNFIFLMASLLVCSLTKTTGLIVFLVISVFFILKTIAQPNINQRLKLSKYFIGAILIFIGVVVFAGGYYTYYKKYKSLPTTAWNNADPPPSFFKETTFSVGFPGRPGVLNMASSFFTFRYFDMIKQPYINNEVGNYPMHRTSVWSQLYGRTAFVQFDQWPPAWQTVDSFIVFIGRVLIILGLIPLLLFLSGLCGGVFLFFKNVFKNGKTYLASENNYLHLGITFALFAASLKYSYDIRDFSAMKSIYIFPGFISFIKLIADGYASVKFRVVTKIINVGLIVIIAFSITDICYLIYHLKYNLGNIF